MLRSSATDPAMATAIVRSLDADPWSAPEAARPAGKPASSYEPTLARMRSTYPVWADRFAPSTPSSTLTDANRPYGFLIVVPVAWGTFYGRPCPPP